MRDLSGNETAGTPIAEVLLDYSAVCEKILAAKGKKG